MAIHQIVTPAGWTQLDQFIMTSGDDVTTGLWRRVVTSAAWSLRSGLRQLL